MAIEDFLLEFVQQENASLMRVLFAFLGYVTLAGSGCILVTIEYCKNNVEKEKNAKNSKWCLRWNILLALAFISAGLTCFLLCRKYDGRKNFCIDWLPAERTYYPSDMNQDRAIEKFLEDYRTFDMGKGIPDYMEKYLKGRGEKLLYGAPSTIRSRLFQNEWFQWLSYLLIFFSIDCYLSAIRGICLRDPNIRPATWAIPCWLVKKGKVASESKQT